MSDERYTFESTRVRLDEILVAVRRKDTSLEQSLELLEEGVRLANLCNELIDQTSWKAPEASEADAADLDAPAADAPPSAVDVAAPGSGGDVGDGDALEDDERD